jgi:hypothetical protein
MAHRLVPRARQTHRARDSKIIQRTARHFGASKKPQPTVLSGDAVDTAAKNFGADAFSWEDQIYVPPQPDSPRRDTLVAHEAAHVYQNRPSDNKIRRKANVQFEQGAWDATTDIYDHMGNVWQSDSMGDQFVNGAEKYLGVIFERSGTGLTYKDTDATKRTKFAGNYAQSKTIRHTIFTDAGAADRDVTVDQTYALAVFDAAVDALKTASINVVVNTRQPEAVTTNTITSEGENPDVKVNPSVYGRYLMEENVAPAYDGFWIIMHEAFHRVGKAVYGGLASVREKSTGIEESDRGNYGLDPKNYGDSMLSPGPIVSLVNVLRAGCKLPTRSAYGETGQVFGPLKDTLFPGDMESTYTKLPFKSNLRGPGVVREPTTWDTLDRRRFITYMIENEWGGRATDVWTKRLEQATLSISGLKAGQDIVFRTVGGRVVGREFNPDLESSTGESIELYANWKTTNDGDTLYSGGYPALSGSGLPVPKMGPVDFELLGNNGFWSGRGDFEARSPFYTSSGIAGEKYVDRGELEGEWYAKGRSGGALGAGYWTLTLGGPYAWDLGLDGIENGALTKDPQLLEMLESINADPFSDDLEEEIEDRMGEYGLFDVEPTTEAEEEADEGGEL